MAGQQTLDLFVGVRIPAPQYISSEGHCRDERMPSFFAEQ